MGGPRWLRELVAALCALYLGLALFPGVHAAAVTGLETSFVWAINWLPGSPYLYGRDVNFLYGPLGYLALPMDLGANLPRALLAQVGLHALLIVAAWQCLRRGSPLSALVSAALLVYAAVLDSSAQLRALVAAALLAGWLVSAGSALAAVLLAALAAGLLFVKLSLGAAACSLFFFGLSLAYARPPRPAAVMPIAGLVAFALALAGVAQSTLGSVAQLEPFLRTGYALAGGYAEAMALDGPALTVWLAVAALAVLGAAAFLLRRLGEGDAPLTLLLLLAALFVTFKTGFVRQDARSAIFFAFVLAAAAILASQVASVRGSGVAAGAGVALVVIGLFAVPRAATPWAASGLFACDEGLANLRALRPSQAAAKVAHAEVAAGARLPEEWLREIREAGGTVDALPPDFAFIAANELRYSPAPLVQSFVACTPALDALQAAHYRGDRAADFLVVSVQGIDGRHALLDTPQAWRAIRDRYEVAGMHPDGKRLLLRRRKQRRESAFVPDPVVFSTPARGFTVPAAAHGGFVALRCPLSWRGRIDDALLRAAPVFAQLTYADGKEASYRLVMANAEGGLALGALPRTGEELARWMDAADVPPVREGHLTGPGLAERSELLGVAWSRPTAAR